mgnify:CR=1 FL=1
MKALIVSAALALLVCNGAQAGDAAAGKAKSAVCAACHGPDGNSATPMWPKLAGQGEAYLVKQLTEFRLGAQTEGKKGRFEPSMAPMAAPLSDADIADLAAYFASQKVQYGGVKKEFVDAGQKLYRGGDTSRGIPACTACHGPAGRGVPGPSYPSLGGQHAGYTTTMLKTFKATPAGSMLLRDANYVVMAEVAARLSDEEITALATYLQGLHDRADAAVAAKP